MSAGQLLQNRHYDMSMCSIQVSSAEEVILTACESAILTNDKYLQSSILTTKPAPYWDAFDSSGRWMSAVMRHAVRLTQSV